MVEIQCLFFLVNVLYKSAFFFFLNAPTTETKGIGGLRAQNLLIARLPANEHRRVFAAGRLVVIQSSFISVVLIFCLSTQ